jgi:hypothetical protein
MFHQGTESIGKRYLADRFSGQENGNDDHHRRAREKSKTVRIGADKAI